MNGYSQCVYDLDVLLDYEYRASNPSLPIDKELYMEHDEKVMNMMIEFLEDE